MSLRHQASREVPLPPWPESRALSLFGLWVMAQVCLPVLLLERSVPCGAPCPVRSELPHLSWSLGAEEGGAWGCVWTGGGPALGPHFCCPFSLALTPPWLSHSAVWLLLPGKYPPLSQLTPSAPHGNILGPRLRFAPSPALGVSSWGTAGTALPPMGWSPRLLRTAF